MRSTWFACLLLCLVAAPCAADDAGAPAYSPPVLGDRDLGVAKGVKKLAVASFVVQFVTAQTANGGGVAVSFEKELLAEPGRLQAMTEAMYGRFRTRLAEAGYEVVPHEALLATPEFRTMQEKSTATPLVMETGSPGSKSGAYKSHFHVPAGLVLNLKGDEYDNLKSGYTGFSQIVDILAQRRLGFDPETGRGIILTAEDCAESGFIEYLSVAPTRSEAFQLEAAFEMLLAGLGAAAPGVGHLANILAHLPAIEGTPPTEAGRKATALRGKTGKS